MSSPELSQEHYIQAETEKVLKTWKKNPVYLASTSSFRKKGLEEIGFRDVRTEVVPDEKEREAQTEYNDNFSPGFWDKKGRGHTQDIASAKVQTMKVPLDCLGIALDTMPYRYVKNPEYGKKPGFESYWRAEPMNKPETLDKAKEEVVNSFLTLARNYLRSIAMKKTLSSDGDYSDDFLEAFKGGVNPEISIEVITSVAIKFPGLKDLESYPINVRLLPKKVYQLVRTLENELAKGLEVGKNVYDYILDELEPEDLRHIIVDGKELEEYFVEMARDIFMIMTEEGTSPTKISGGINYGSKRVRDYLRIEEFNVSGYDMEDGIYLGFPKKFIEEIITNKARSVAMKNL